MVLTVVNIGCMTDWLAENQQFLSRVQLQDNIPQTVMEGKCHGINSLHGAACNANGNGLHCTLKVFVVVIPKEGWTRVAAPILLLV